MPPRQPALPEGTDHVVRGASVGERDAGGDDREAGRAAPAKRSASRSGGSAVDTIMSQVRDQAATLKGQAGDRLRGFADGGKTRAVGALDDFGEVIAEAAAAIERKFGADYAGYAQNAAGAVSGFADTVRGKDIDELVGDVRDFVRKSPALAIGIAAIAGFALVRLVKTGLDDAGAATRRAANDGD